MNKADFNEQVVERRIQLIKSVLQQKGQEYAAGDRDVFHNFKNSSPLMFGMSPEKVAWGFMTKHMRSVMDIIEDLDCGDCYMGSPKVEVVEEKFGDFINYLILIEGMLKERIIEYEKKKPTFPPNGHP